MSNFTLINRDLQHIWHPCSQMKDYKTLLPLPIKRAEGSYLELEDGRKIIDAISSWWCKSLGHNHPELKTAMLKQLERFEHVIFANTTYDTIVSLSEKLVGLTQALKKVFFAGDGSCAVEAAMKMSLHSRQITGKTQKTKFIALQNAYHGETVGALSVSDVGIYKEAYKAILFQHDFIQHIPYVSHSNDSLWSDCREQWTSIEKYLAPLAETATALIVEPIVQGAGGMQIYSQDFLKRLRKWTQQNDVHLIADEIMTGMGRTGKMLACEHADIEPDFLCLGKGLTSGFMPFSAVLTRDDVYDLFYDDYEKGKSFLHSHTFCGNALAASIALNVFDIFARDRICEHANQLGAQMYAAMQKISQDTKKIKNIRQIGAIVAADLVCNDPRRRLGFEFYQKAIARGALMRPLGNTIYWLPPLNSSLDLVAELKQMTESALSDLAF